VNYITQINNFVIDPPPVAHIFVSGEGLALPGQKFIDNNEKIPDDKIQLIKIHTDSFLFTILFQSLCS
jgi:hypothetical protein